VRRFSVRVPGSSANLGAGFDSLAVTLAYWLRVTVVQRDDRVIRDAGAPELFGGENLVIDAMRIAAERFGLDLPGCDITVESDIPVARGLGSSAAAIVAGLVAAGEIAGRPISVAELIDLSGEIEGHADNVSASILGGVTVSIKGHRGWLADVVAATLPWTPVVFVPATHAFTSEARAILPRVVPMPDVVANVGRAGLFVHALHARRADLLRDAMDDRLHQPTRSTIFPHLYPCIEAALAAGAVGACLSGAGPAVLAFAAPEYASSVAEALQRAALRCGVEGDARCSSVPRHGVQVSRLDD